MQLDCLAWWSGGCFFMFEKLEDSKRKQVLHMIYDFCFIFLEESYFESLDAGFVQQCIAKTISRPKE